MATFLKLLRRVRTCDSGAEFIEMALAFPMLLLVVLGIMDFGIMFQRYEVMTNAAREGARVAVLPDYSDDDAIQRAEDYLAASFLGGDGIASVSIDGPTPVSVGGNCMNTKTVWVFYPHQFEYLSGIIGYFGGNFGSRTLTASSTMRVEAPSVACP
jgi:Flp pilus assembly protein TadG